jgi:hypothetical protein
MVPPTAGLVTPIWVFQPRFAASREHLSALVPNAVDLFHREPFTWVTSTRGAPSPSSRPGECPKLASHICISDAATPPMPYRQSPEGSPLLNPSGATTEARPGRPEGAVHVHCVCATVRALKARGPHVSPSATPTLTALATGCVRFLVVADVHNDVRTRTRQRLELHFDGQRFLARSHCTDLPPLNWSFSCFFAAPTGFEPVSPP